MRITAFLFALCAIIRLPVISAIFFLLLMDCVERLIPLAPALPTFGDERAIGAPSSARHRQDADRAGSNGISLCVDTERTAQESVRVEHTAVGQFQNILDLPLVSNHL
jgi:hypothetical protein